MVWALGGISDGKNLERGGWEAAVAFGFPTDLWRGSNAHRGVQPPHSTEVMLTLALEIGHVIGRMDECTGERA